MSQLSALIKKVNEAPTIRDGIALLQERYVKNYEMVSGKKDGRMRFESELLTYQDIVSEKPELAKITDKFSHAVAVMKSANTGLSFKADGHLYPIVYGGKIKVQIGAHGKREMLRQMKEIKMVYEGQVVYKGDSFKHDKLNNKIIEHVTTDKSVNTNKLDDIVAAYTRLEYVDGRIIDVVVYREEILKAMAASKNKGAGSVWDTWPGQMAVKVSYHRAKKLYHRYPENLEFNVGKDEEDEETEDTTYTSVQEQVPESTQAEPSPDESEMKAFGE